MTRLQFKQAYRIARQPDLYLAHDTDGQYRYKLDIPLGVFMLAVQCLEARLK